MIHTKELFSFYRGLRQTSPAQSQPNEVWQVADYHNVQQVLPYLTLPKGMKPVTLPDAAEWKSVFEAHISTILPDQSGDFILDVLEPATLQWLPELTQRIIVEHQPLIGQLFCCELPLPRFQKYIQTLYHVDEETAQNVTAQFIQRELFIALVSNALLALLSNPKQVALLNAYPHYAMKTVQETLRFVPPIQRVRFITPTAIPFGDSVIPHGQKVELHLAAANHDPFIYRNADVFDMNRNYPVAPLVAYENLVDTKTASEVLRYLVQQFHHIHLMYKPSSVLHRGMPYIRRIASMPVAWAQPVKKLQRK